MSERDEWLRTESFGGVSRQDIYARPDLHDLPVFACSHPALSVKYAGVTCARCKTLRERMLRQMQRDADTDRGALGNDLRGLAYAFG